MTKSRRVCFDRDADGSVTLVTYLDCVRFEAPLISHANDPKFKTLRILFYRLSSF